jgi:hypothetical protein
MLYKALSIPKWLLTLFLLLNFHTCFSQKFDAELLNQQTVIEVSLGKLVQTNYFEICINNRNGDKYAEISIPFNKMYKVSNIEASVSDISGTEVKKLKKGDIIEHSESSPISFYDDTYVKEFTLRNHTYPYTLKYSYRIDASQFMFIAHWFPVIDNEIPTRQASLKISTPAGYRIYYNSNRAGSPKIDSVPGQIYYSWITSYTNPVKPETYSPPLQQFVPFVEVVPETFRYDIQGSQESWKSYGNWNYTLLNGLGDLPESEKIKIRSLVNTTSDEKEKVRILFHYLQDATRYINVSIKTGGMKPFPASYVAENKYGDCKALSNYFRSCLSLLDIKSYYTTINAGEVIEPINSEFPSQQFNHVIVFVPFEKDTLWVDCTSDLAFGYLGTFTQKRPALVLDYDASKLINTPALTYNDVLETRKITAKINPDHALKADFANLYRGDKYELLSYISTSLSESERSQYLGRKVVETGFQLDTYSISVPERDKPEIKLNYTASSDKMLKEYGNEVLLEVIPMRFPFQEEPRKRKLPVQIDYPVYKIDSIEYVIPGNYKISAIPENVNISSQYGEYRAEFRQKEQSVLVIKQVKINSGSYPLDVYPDFYNFIMRLHDSENSFYISLTKI